MTALIILACIIVGTIAGVIVVRTLRCVGAL